MKRTELAGMALALTVAAPCCAEPGAGYCALTPVAGVLMTGRGPVVVETTSSPRLRLARLTAAPGRCTAPAGRTASAMLMSFGYDGVSA